MRDTLAKIIDPDAFDLPAGAIDGEFWGMRRDLARRKADLIAAEIARQHQDPVPRRIVVHKKRGSVYVVLGEATVQTAHIREIKDYDKLVVYQSEHGDLWCRFPDEMWDGRFSDV